MKEEFKLPKQVKTVDDVRQFFVYLVAVDNVAFHPDDSFYSSGEVQHVDHQGKPTYTVAEAKLRDRLMRQSWTALGEAKIDIYCFAMWIGHELGYSEEPDHEMCPPFSVEILPPSGPRAWSPRKKKRH
jgi:hypothetical protein